MKKILLIVTLLCFGSIFAQNDTWYAFFDEEYNRGFKDANGRVMIKPKFTGATIADKFDRIMGAMELIDGHYALYYLLKNGRQFAQDSIYFHDMTFDCESEGFMKFHGKDGAIGMFNGESKIAIPAMYNELSPCHNGYIVALTGAVKKWDGEYASWEGGTHSLIDRNNNTIISDFKDPYQYNLYSLKITNVPVNDPIRETFEGTDGRYYSFIDDKKEFMQFLDGFLKELTPEKLAENTFSTLIYEDSRKERIWHKQSGKKFPNPAVIAQRLLEVKKMGADYNIYPGRLFVDEDLEKTFETYTDNCGKINYSKYPVWQVIVTHLAKDKNNKPLKSEPDAPATHKDGYERYADVFEFIKTDSGFKLFTLRLSQVELK